MNYPPPKEAYGAAFALAFGLILGGAMHPNLAGDDRPGGPQIIAGSGGARSAGPDRGATLASYSTNVPDYVVGTDARRITAWTPERAMAQPRYQPAAASADELPTISRAAYAAYDDEPRRPHYYPSVGQAPRDEPDEDDGGPAARD